MATLPVDRPVTPLRQRMLDDMAMRSMRARTQHDYVRHVHAFAAFLGRSPDTATAEDVRRFQLHQREQGAGGAVIGAAVSALRFLFTVTLDRPDLSRRLVLAPRPKKLPDVLSVEEVARLLEAAPGIKYRAALGVAYGAGLRVSEVAHLKADDIDSKRMLIRIEEGKGRKDRNAMLSPQLHRPGLDRQLHRAVHEAADAAGIRKRVRKKRWVVYAKPPFAGPETVLAYLSRYTHRVAISNSRLMRFDQTGVTFRYKDYRRPGADRQQVMTLAADEFIRRFLLHVLPKGFHRIRHYGLLAGATRKARLDHVRQLLGVAPPATTDAPVDPPDVRPPCPCCGGHMVVIETFERSCRPRAPPHGVSLTGTITS